ncbi:hypothetical protein IC582_025447 [Cucumis melo]
MTLGKQARLEAGCSSVPSTEGVIIKGKGTRGPTGMSEIKRVSCDGHKRVVEYNELGQPIAESATKLKSFIGTTVRVHVPISYQSWKDVPTELKDKIYELIEKASTSNGELIDHALVWKKARTTKDGEIPDIDTKEVANKIDNLLVSKRASHSMDNVTCDILSQAIGGNDPPRRIRGVGQYVTPSKYFHTAREKRKKVGKAEDYAEERARMAAHILELEAELMKYKRVPEVATKEETDESKIKSQMASKSIDTSDDANDNDAKEENRQVLEDLIIEKQDKVGEENKYVCASIETLTKVKDDTSCLLAIGTKNNVVGAGTIFDYDMDGDNVKVSVDMVTDGNCFIESVYQADPRLPSLTLNTKRAPVTLRLLLWELDYIGSKIQIHVPVKVFGYERKCYIFLEALQEFCQMQPISTQCIDAFMFHLYKVMEENGTLGSYKFADAGSVSVGISKEDRAQILNARLLGTNHRQILMFPYNSEAFDISNKKKPVWRIIKCLKQGGIGECGYYVMRFMHDILSSNRTIIEVLWCLWNGGGKSMFRFINDLGNGERDSESAKFMFKLNFDFRRGEGVGNWGGGGGKIPLCLIMTLEGGSELLRLEMTWGGGGWD